MEVIEVRKLPGTGPLMASRQEVRHRVADEAEARLVLARLQATARELAAAGVTLEAHIIFWPGGLRCEENLKAWEIAYLCPRKAGSVT